MMGSTSVIIKPKLTLLCIALAMVFALLQSSRKGTRTDGDCPSDAAPRRTSLLGIQARSRGTYGRDELGNNPSQESKTLGSRFLDRGFSEKASTP